MDPRASFILDMTPAQESQWNQMRQQYEAAGMPPEQALNAANEWAKGQGFGQPTVDVPQTARAPVPPAPVGTPMHPSMNARMNGNVRASGIPPVAGAIRPNNVTQRMSGQVPMPVPPPGSQPGAPAPTLPAPQTVGSAPNVANNFKAAGPRVRNVSNTAQPASLMSSFAARDPNKPFPGTSNTFFPLKPEGPEDWGEITDYARRHMRRSPQLARALMHNRGGLY